MLVANILLIDDEEDIRDSVANVLRRAGHEVSAVSSAEEGIFYSKNNTVDLVITDLIMPGMNGVEFIRQFRKDHPVAKIIAISGGGNFGPTAYKPEAITTTAYLEAAAEAGADAVMTKPFQRNELLAQVGKLIESQEQ